METNNNKHIYLHLNEEDYNKFMDVMVIFAVDSIKSTMNMIINEVIKRYRRKKIEIYNEDRRTIKWKRNVQNITKPVSGFIDSEQLRYIEEIMNNERFNLISDTLRWMIRDFHRNLTISSDIREKLKTEDHNKMKNKYACDEVVHIRISDEDNARFKKIMFKKRNMKKSACWRWIISEFMNEYRKNNEIFKLDNAMKYFIVGEQLKSVAFRIPSNVIEDIRPLIEKGSFKTLSEVIRFMVRWVFKYRIRQIGSIVND